ncbi:MAG: hypothetical protein HY870_09105 [Chloroflexi bacterium]|nr:hypothetical protein [Chloroflexota bacterium]
MALVGMCGAYRREIDCPFDAGNYYGDPSFREIPRNTRPGDLAFAHHFNHEHVDQDAAAGFPLTALIELEREGVISRFIDPAISFSGYLPQPRQLISDTAPFAAKRLLEADTQAASPGRQSCSCFAAYFEVPTRAPHKTACGAVQVCARWR